jgi:hypothetical protein
LRQENIKKVCIKNKNVMKKIDRFRFQSLSNVEFVRVILHIIAIAEKYSVVPQQLKKRFDTLKFFLPELDRIEVQERKWRESKTLDEYERSRDAYVNILIRIEQTHSQVSIPGFEEASKKLTTLFDKHGRDIASDRNIAETQRIYNLIEDIERTPGMLDILAIFAMTPAYNAMKEANSRFDELWQQRNKELSEVEHVDTKTIRADCVKAVHAFYEGIEYWGSESDDVQWSQLIAELSELGSYYDQQIKARITRRKNKENTDNELLIDLKHES